jgi:hypothetical protein
MIQLVPVPSEKLTEDERHFILSKSVLKRTESYTYFWGDTQGYIMKNAKGGWTVVPARRGKFPSQAFTSIQEAFEYLEESFVR